MLRNDQTSENTQSTKSILSALNNIQQNLSSLDKNTVATLIMAYLWKGVNGMTTNASYSTASPSPSEKEVLGPFFGVLIGLGICGCVLHYCKKEFAQPTMQNDIPLVLLEKGKNSRAQVTEDESEDSGYEASSDFSPSSSDELEKASFGEKPKISLETSMELKEKEATKQSRSDGNKEWFSGPISDSENQDNGEPQGLERMQFDPMSNKTMIWTSGVNQSSEASKEFNPDATYLIITPN